MWENYEENFKDDCGPQINVSSALFAIKTQPLIAENSVLGL
jgi:hypothetical protein